MRALLVVKTALKAHFGVSILLYYIRRRDRRLWGAAGIVAAVVVGLLPILFLYSRFVTLVFEGGQAIGQPQVVLTLAIVMSTSLVLILAFAFVLSVFYFSSDLGLLVPLPLRPYEVLAGRYAIVLVSEYLTIAPFMIPALAVFGVRTDAGPAYWLTAVLIYLLVPVVPVSIASWAAMGLMRVANLSRRKDAVRLIGMGLLLIGLLGLNFLLTRIQPGMEADAISAILADDGLVRFAGRAYPPAVWATRALAGGTASLIGLAGFAAAAVGAAFVSLAGAQVLFYDGLIGAEEIQSGSGRVRPNRFQARHPACAIMIRDLKILIRTPIYVFNSIAVVILVPIILVLPMLSGGQDAMLQFAVDPGISRLIGVAFVAVTALFGPASSSSFSREGREFWISRVIPVPAATQVRGKLMQGLLVTALALPFVATFGLGVAGWTALDLVAVLAAGFAAGLPMISLSLGIDLFRPYLTWDSPQQAIKQNLNVVFAMVGGGALLAGGGWLVLRLLRVGNGPNPSVLVVGAALFVIGLVIHLTLERASDRLYSRIQI